MYEGGPFKRDAVQLSAYSPYSDAPIAMQANEMYDGSGQYPSEQGTAQSLIKRPSVPAPTISMQSNVMYEGKQPQYQHIDETSSYDVPLANSAQKPKSSVFYTPVKLSAYHLPSSQQPVVQMTSNEMYESEQPQFGYNYHHVIDLLNPESARIASSVHAYESSIYVNDYNA